MVPGIFKIGGDYSDLARSYERNVLAQRKAATEAFDKYFNENLKNIDPNAVRPQDRLAFDALLKKWKDFGIANKKAILSDPAAKRTHEEMFTNLSRLVQDSKDRIEAAKPLLNQLDDPQNKYRINYTKAFASIDANDQPLLIQDQSGNWVKNPNSIRLDFKQNYWKPEVIEKNKFFDAVSLGKDPVEVYGSLIPNDPKVNPRAAELMGRYEILQPKIVEYPKNSILEMAKEAEALVVRDPKYKDAFEAEYQTIPKREYDELNNLYQTYFPGQEIKGGLELAKAQAIKYAVGRRKEELIPVPDKDRLEKKRQAERAQDKRDADRKTGGSSVNVYDVIAGEVVPSDDYTGIINLSTNKIPAKLSLAMRGLGYKAGFGGVDVNVQNGKIISVAPAGFAGIGALNAPITRADILIGQQKAGKDIDWGSSTGGKQQTKKGSDPLGLGF